MKIYNPNLNQSKYDKVLCIIYVDLEYLIEKIDGCKFIHKKCE